jgi:hypothetical protein
MRWKSHVRFGGRAGETDRWQQRHGAPARSHLANAALDKGLVLEPSTDRTGHRGHKHDPLYRIRRRLLASHDRLDPAGFARVLAWLDAGDPAGEVGAAYLAKELLRETFDADDVFDARQRLVTFYQYCAASDVPELERLARTIARWETPILRWHRTHLTNAATEGTNLVIKNIKRLSVNRPSMLGGRGVRASCGDGPDTGVKRGLGGGRCTWSRPVTAFASMVALDSTASWRTGSCRTWR